ncbi:Serine/threonine-protein phosphatase 7 long form homolog, partial [Linum grandiflorum]
ILVSSHRWWNGGDRKQTFYKFRLECTVTLEDVAMLTGLPVTDDTVHVEYNNKEMDWVVLVGEILGEMAGSRDVKTDECLKVSWLREKFEKPSDIPNGDPRLGEYARAYMLGAIGAFLLGDRSSAYVRALPVSTAA